MAFLFRENRRHGTDRQTDGVQHLMRTPRESRVRHRSSASTPANQMCLFESVLFINRTQLNHKVTL